MGKRCVHFGDCYQEHLKEAKTGIELMSEEEFQETECGNRFPWCD